MQDFNVINLWPNFMSHTHYAHDLSSIKEKILKENSSNSLPYQKTTTVNGIQHKHSVEPWNWKDEEWQPIKDFIQLSLDQYKKTLYPQIEDAFDPIVKRSWAVTYNTGGYQEPHCHPHMDISGLFTVQSSEQGGDIVFTNPAIQSSYTNFQPYSQKFKPDTGDLLLWPAWLLHYTIPTGGPSQKIVISFDARLYE